MSIFSISFFADLTSMTLIATMSLVWEFRPTMLVGATFVDEGGTALTDHAVSIVDVVVDLLDEVTRW